VLRAVWVKSATPGYRSGGCDRQEIGDFEALRLALARSGGVTAFLYAARWHGPSPKALGGGNFKVLPAFWGEPGRHPVERAHGRPRRPCQEPECASRHRVSRRSSQHAERSQIAEKGLPCYLGLVIGIPANAWISRRGMEIARGRRVSVKPGLQISPMFLKELLVCAFDLLATAPFRN
jgi:hypothetical protein